MSPNHKLAFPNTDSEKQGFKNLCITRPDGWDDPRSWEWGLHLLLSAHRQPAAGLSEALLLKATLSLTSRT